jgi:hypothetical protein
MLRAAPRPLSDISPQKCSYLMGVNALFASRAVITFKKGKRKWLSTWIYALLSVLSNANFD